MKKKVFMIFALLCAVAQVTWAQTAITYVERSWDDVNKKVVDKDVTTSDYTEISGTGDWVGLEGGKTYYVTGECTYLALNVMGENAHLVLGDGCMLNLKHIKLEVGKSLHIHTLKGKSGKIDAANDTYKGAAGIGGGQGENSGTLYIHDGEISTRGYECAAGIGGGESASCGDVYIYGGNIHAYSGIGGAGIGGGEDRGINLTNSVNIYGGEVYAKGTCFTQEDSGWFVNKWGAGIGGGDEGSQGGPIYIHGGKVTAETQNGHGAGIGGGDKGNGGTVEISGGSVYAYARYNTTAIGAGYKGNGGSITITGGLVEADTRLDPPYTDKESGSVGLGTFNGENGSLTITGGKVLAVGYRNSGIKANMSFGYVRVYYFDYQPVECDDRISFAEYYQTIRVEQCVEHEYVDFRCKWCGWFDKEGALNSWEGKGTAEEPYLVKTDADWRVINSNLLYNTDYGKPDAKPYDGIYFRQTADINTSTGVGVTGWGNDRIFYGNYDGDGHELNFSLSLPKVNSGEAMAAFHRVSGSTIKNLHVSGSINGGIHSAGLVAYVDNAVTIDNCRVSAEVTCSGNSTNDAHGGGFVGHAGSSTVTVTNSAFDGKLNASANGKGDIHLGAIVGWAGADVTIENCFEAGKYQGFTDNGQTSLYWKDANNTTPDKSSSNIYISDLGHTDGATKALSVTTQQKDLTLYFNDVSGYYWVNAYLGAIKKYISEDYNREGYLVGDTFYTMIGRTVTFNIDLPWFDENTSVYANGTEVFPYSMFAFEQGSEPTLITALELIEIKDNENNDALIRKYDGATADVTFTGRKFYKDGSWNTFCFPFDLRDVDPFFDDAEVCTLVSSSYNSTDNTNTLTLNFDDPGETIEAGKPCLVRWDNTGEVIENPKFEQVIIKNQLQPITTDKTDLLGSFSPVSLNKDDRSVLYMGADNKLYYPAADITMGACRAYFKLKGLTIGDLKPESDSGSTNAIILHFGDDETTGVSTPLSLWRGAGSEAYFTLDGRRLSGKPTQPGLYIRNGEKVVIK